MPKALNVKVTTMDSELEFAIQPNTTGKQLFDQIAKTIGIRELWFFGLQYVDIKGYTAWLKMNKKIMAQDLKKETPLQFRFRVKFFPEDVSEELIQDITRRMFYLQVKESVLSEEIFSPPETAVLLASYACQSRFGDRHPDLHPEGFLIHERLLPTRIMEQHRMPKSEWDSKIQSWWGEHAGMAKDEAMLEYLKIAQDLEMYGVNYFEIKNKKGTDLLLGVDSMGLNVYSPDDKLTPKIGFPWSEISNISFNDKKFIIKPTDKKSPDFVFFTPRLRINKRILALCMGNHELYVRRRKPDTIEIQQMKAQAKEERLLRKEDRERLGREREAREAAEKRLADLEERLRHETSEKEVTVREMGEYQSRVRSLEERLAEEKEHRVRLEELQRQLEQNNKELAEAHSSAKEDRERLLRERETIEQEIEAKSTSYSQSVQELKRYEAQVEKLRRERLLLEEKTKQLEEAALVKEDNYVEHSKQYNHDMNGLENGSVHNRSEESRETVVTKNSRLHSQLKALGDELRDVREIAKLAPVDQQHEANQKQGKDKFKTLKQIRQGNTKKRIDEFESM